MYGNERVTQVGSAIAMPWGGACVPCYDHKCRQHDLDTVHGCRGHIQRESWSVCTYPDTPVAIGADGAGNVHVSRHIA